MAALMLPPGRAQPDKQGGLEFEPDTAPVRQSEHDTAGDGQPVKPAIPDNTKSADLQDLIARAKATGSDLVSRGQAAGSDLVARGKAVGSDFAGQAGQFLGEDLPKAVGRAAYQGASAFGSPLVEAISRNAPSAEGVGGALARGASSFGRPLLEAAGRAAAPYLGAVSTPDAEETGGALARGVTRFGSDLAHAGKDLISPYAAALRDDLARSSPQAGQAIRNLRAHPVIGGLMGGPEPEPPGPPSLWQRVKAVPFPPEPAPAAPPSVMNNVSALFSGRQPDPVPQQEQTPSLLRRLKNVVSPAATKTSQIAFVRSAARVLSESLARR